MMGRRIQRNNETCMEYIAVMCQWFEELDMTDEREKIAVIQNGLRDCFRTIAHAQKWSSVAELDQLLRQYEMSNDVRRFAPAPSRTFASEVQEESVSEIYDEAPLIEFGIEEQLKAECMEIGRTRDGNMQRKTTGPQVYDRKEKFKKKGQSAEELKQKMAKWVH